MIYTRRAWWATRSTWLWGASTVVVAAALGVLLSATLVACGGPADPSGNASERLTDTAAGAAGLGGAGRNPDGTPATPSGDGADGGETDGAGTDGGDGADGGGAGTGGDGASGGHGASGGGDANPDAGEPGDGVAPSAQDCVSYDPANLSVEAYGDAWRMRSGGHLMKLFDTKADAEDAVKVARNWTRMCFIGRGNDRPDRYRYIVTYWQGPSGLPLGPAPVFDCISYDPAGLAVHGPDADGWGLRAGGVPLLFLDTAADAARAKLVAAEQRQLCLIGHGNGRPDPARYVMQHWRQ